MPVDSLTVRLGHRSYDIVCAHDAVPGLAACIRRRCLGQCILVTDAHVRHHAQQLRDAFAVTGTSTGLIVLEPGEAQKSLATAGLLYDRLAELQADRQTLLVAMGGGVIGDLTGFVAATFNRGLPLFMVPTTLLAMVDSAVGGKTGVNHPRGKNLIGAFHQPCAVWIDTAYLATLPDREFRSALAEVVKYGMILDPALLQYLEGHAADILTREPAALRHIILESCRLKASVVEQDEYETKGLRVILNYGHTFAHAFETVTGYGHFLHGEAVALGMVCASRLAEKLGRIPMEATERQMRLLEQFGLPVSPRDKVEYAQKPVFSLADLLRVMYNDKKTQAGKLRFVLPARVGHVELVDNVPEELVRQVLHEAAA